MLRRINNNARVAMDSVPPSHWGPALWKVLHLSATAYPHTPCKQTQEQQLNTILSLPSLLPCQACAFNYRDHLRNYNLRYVVSSREQLINFWISLHNTVNAHLGKPQMSLEDAKNLYAGIK